ncbi:MAG: SRPBCC family protein [Myxococcota bacterium]
MDASAQVKIERPLDEVFAFATDVQYFDQWVLGVRNSRWLTGAPRRAHAEFELTYSYAGVPLDFVFEVARYEKNVAQDIESLAGPMTVEVQMAFDARSSSTRVERHVEFYLSPMPLPIIETLTFLAKPALAARIKGDLVRLKQCIEGTSVTPGLSGAAIG